MKTNGSIKIAASVVRENSVASENWFAEFGTCWLFVAMPQFYATTDFDKAILCENANRDLVAGYNKAKQGLKPLALLMKRRNSRIATSCQALGSCV